MLFFLFLGLIELIGILLLYSVVHKHVVSRWRRKHSKIGKDTVILITGAAFGVGKQLVIKFVQKHQCTIVVYDIRKDLCEILAQEVELLGGKFFYYICDISNEELLTETIKQTLNKFKNIDILINYAGVANMKLLQDTTIDEIRDITYINYLGTVSIIQKILPNMISNQKGHIVNISSVAAFVSGIKMSDYSASKAAIAGFHNALRQELRLLKTNVKTTIIYQNTLSANLFKAWESNVKFLFPILEETVIAQEMYESIIDQKKELFIPWSWKQAAFLLRSLPASLVDKIILYMLGEITAKLLQRQKRNNRVQSQTQMIQHI